MLRQEINLYQSFKKPESDTNYFTWKRYWILNYIFTGIMVLVFIGSIMQTFYLRREYENLQIKLVKFQQEFKKLKSTFPQLFFSENIGEAVTSLQKQMAAQKKIIGILSKHSPFSNVLLGLSHTIINNVWLTEILIDKSGDLITLTGNSIGMGNINLYIDSLKKDKNFEGYSVTVKEVQSVNDHSDTKARLIFQINMAKNENE